MRFRIDSKADADDVLQEVYLAAYLSFPRLRDRSAFKAWLVSIAANKCRDFFRRQASRAETPLDTLEAIPASGGVPDTDGASEADAVRAATYNPACAIGAEREIGLVAPGYRADFVICSGDFTGRRVFLDGQEVG